MYKVGVIMQDKGDTAKAKAVYQQVITKYHGTDGAKQAQNALARCNEHHATRNRVNSGRVV